MSNLYEINSDLSAAIELASTEENLSLEDGKWLFDVINSLKMELDQKLENCGKYYKNENAIADMIDAEIKMLQSRKKAHEKKAESIKNWIQYNVLPGQKIEFPSIIYSWRKSERVIIDSESTIPDDLCKIERKPQLSLCKDAIKAGREIPAHIEIFQNLQIK